MKLVKIIVAILAGLFALAQCVYLAMLALRGEPVSAMMGSIAGICIGGVVSVLLFRSAFGGPGTGGEQ